MGLIDLVVKVWKYMFLHSKKSYRRISNYNSITYPVMPISRGISDRLESLERKVLVLDLDETLIHSHHEGVMRQGSVPDVPHDFVLKVVVIDRHPVRFFVHKRPYVDLFLDIVSEWYELVVFTASLEIYGSAIANYLDRNKNILKRRYYRQHCLLESGSFTKDLSSVCEDLASVFIIDNSPGAYRGYPDNAIPMKSWFSDQGDRSLLNLLPFLDALRFTKDVRSVLRRNLHLTHTN